MTCAEVIEEGDIAWEENEMNQVYISFNAGTQSSEPSTGFIPPGVLPAVETCLLTNCHSQ